MIAEKNCKKEFTCERCKSKWIQEQDSEGELFWKRVINGPEPKEKVIRI